MAIFLYIYVYFFWYALPSAQAFYDQLISFSKNVMNENDDDDDCSWVVVVVVELAWWMAGCLTCKFAAATTIIFSYKPDFITLHCGLILYIWEHYFVSVFECPFTMQTKQ